MSSRLIPAHRTHPLWYAHLLHRVSGLVLALFLPAHFMLLSTALTDPAGFARKIAWTDQWLVKAGEIGLVFLLAVHLFGGLRLLVLELTPWQPWQKGWAAAAVALATGVALAFFLGLVT